MQKLVKLILFTLTLGSCNVFAHAKSKRNRNFIEKKLAEKKIAKKSQQKQMSKKRKSGYPKVPWAFVREATRPSYRNPNGISGPFSHCGEDWYRSAGSNCNHYDRGIDRFFAK